MNEQLPATLASPQAPSPKPELALSRWCNRLEHAALPGDRAILEEAGLVAGHPWEFLGEMALADPGSVAYYRYLYGVAALADARNILEVGTAFGLGTASLLLGAPRLERLISLDLGVFTKQYEIVENAGGAGWPVMSLYKEQELSADGRNIGFARDALAKLAQRRAPAPEVRLFQVNTQPAASDNFDSLVRVPRWFEVPELVELLERTPLDILFIDGKHSGDGLYQDFKSFFRFVRPGGIVICDDVHDASYPYEWAGQTLASFERARAEFADEIQDMHVWSFPQVPDWYGQEPIRRPWGLVRKRGAATPGALPQPVAPVVIHSLEVSTLEVVRELKFLDRHPGLMSFVDGCGLPDGRIIEWASYLRDRKWLFQEMEAQGLGERAAENLAFMRRQPLLFADQARLDAVEQSVPARRLVDFLDYVLQHPGAAEYLIARPELAADLQRFAAEAAKGKAPNVGLALRLFPRWLAGRYRPTR